MPILYPADTVSNRHDCLQTFLELRRDNRLDVGLLLEYEAREERDDILGVVCGQGVLENELCQDEFVCGVNL